MKRKIILACLAIGVLVASLIVANIVNENLGLQDKVQSCFKRYTKGVAYKGMSVVLLKTIDDESREAITNDQIACSMARLGFDQSLVSQMTQETQGRVDNDKFAVVWIVRDSVECLDPEEPSSGLSWGLGNVSLFSECQNTEVTSSKLQIVLKDYR
jgi:hypothetical protein